MLNSDKPIFKLEVDEAAISNDDTQVEESLLAFKSVEFELLPPVDITDKRRIEIYNNISTIDERVNVISARVEELNAEIDRLTNHADWLDYTIAVSSGVLAGIIDSVWVGEFSLARASSWGKDKVDNFVKKIAQKQGYTGDDLAGAVKHMENKFPFAADKVTNEFGGGKSHHLRDFSHHPTPVGLFFSLLTQFTGNVYGTDVAGLFKVVPVDTIDLIGKNLPEKITFGVVKWFFHMVSDMAGSYTSVLAGKLGTGLPGPLVSFLKEVSSLPLFRNMNEKGYKEFSVWISKLFNGTLLGKRDENGKIIEAIPFDLRAEIGVVHELGRQAVPVIINECIVRGFYFIRRLYREIKINDVEHIADFKNINWKNTLPFKNRTIIRMLTIATGTFTAIDLGDAAIRAAVKSGGFAPGFAGEFILRVNFVGIGRFAIAIAVDIGMGIKKNIKENERFSLKGEQIHLLHAKIFYKEADVWIEAENTDIAMQKLYDVAERSTVEYMKAWSDIRESMDNITDQVVDKAKKNNAGLTSELLDILEWGI